MTFFEELRRRNVLRVAAAYIVTAWLIIQVAETVLPAFALEHHVRTVIIVLAAGFVPVLILAWALEWTPQGIRLDAGEPDVRDSVAVARSARRFDRIVIVILTLALAWFVWDKLTPPAPDALFSVAVLPFENESADVMPDYLAEGLAGEVRDLLAKLPELVVIERSSAFSFKGQQTGLPDIGKALGATHLLAGAIAQTSAGVRIRARLFETVSGTTVWSESYTGRLADIFRIQDEIVEDAVSALGLRSASELPAARRTTPEVLELVLRAKQLWYQNLYSEEASIEAGALLEQASDIDPHYTPALAWRIYTDYGLLQAGRITPEEEDARWAETSVRVLAIEPDNAIVHNSFAWQALHVNRDIRAAAWSYARALRSAPNDAEILRHAARFAVLIGRVEESYAIIERAMAIDPQCSLCMYHASKVYMWTGRLDKAETLRRRFIEEYGQGTYFLGVIKLLQGQYAEAVDIFEALDVTMSEYGGGNDGRAHTGLAMAYHDLGRRDESDAQLQLLIESFGGEHPLEVAKAHAWRGEIDAAFAWLARAEIGSRASDTWIVLDLEYRNLHEDPRWQELRAALDLSVEGLEAIEFPAELLERFLDDDPVN